MNALEFYILSNSIESVQELQTKNEVNILPDVLEISLALLKGKKNNSFVILIHLIRKFS
jgi:hypothetical protein